MKGASPWFLLIRDEVRSFGGEPLLHAEADDFEFEVRHQGGSVWIICTWPSGGRVAYCAAYAPAGASTLKEQKQDGSAIDLRIEAAIGEYRVHIDLPEPDRAILHWQTTLIPATDLLLPYWPRDIVPLDADGDPLGTRGIVHAAQHGAKGGLLFASLTRPFSGSLLYMQNFSALNDFFERTATSPAERVGGNWPELGFSLPPAIERALPAGERVTIADAYVAASPIVPDDELVSARLFLELYTELYLAYPRPIPVHHDWHRRAADTVQDLAHSPECCVEKNEHRYLLAYLGADDRPPESMVQLAVLVPMQEYAHLRGEDIPLVAELEQNLHTFFKPEVGTVVRWLPGEEHRLSGESEKAENVMDSWYLYHSYLNLSRLALDVDGEAKRLFLDSIDYGIRVARRFEYQWPVFYDIHTLEPIRAETKPGAGGEHDVGAQYAHVMLQAWDLTGDSRFLDEATRAARALRGLGFRLGYQFNNTSFGAGGLLRLWRETGEEVFRDLSYVCLANLVRNFWLWECDYGHARYYKTFMGLPPLQDAPYLALYEELEVLAAFHEYLELADDGILPAVRVLLPEYCKYVIDRAWYHYPSELPEDMLAEKTQSGHLNRRLSIPLEDMYDGWRKAGEVGQQVYGAAAPFIVWTRHYHPIPNEDFLVHCDYPISGFEANPTEAGGMVHFRALGDGRCECRLQIIPVSVSPLPDFTLNLHTPAGSFSPSGQLSELGLLEFDIPGNAEAELHWTHAAKAKAKAEADGPAVASDGEHTARTDHRRRRHARRRAELKPRDLRTPGAEPLGGARR